MKWKIRYEGVPAVYVFFDVDPRHQLVGGGFVSIIAPLDCAGKPIPVNLRGGKYSNWLAQHAAGGESLYPDYWCWALPQEMAHRIAKTDPRTLEMMAAACCPPQITAEMLGAESMPGRGEPDAAEEALKLHKRGYFGGGG